MDPSQRVNWLNLSTEQIETVQKQKREQEKEKTKQIIGSLCELETHLLKSINSLHLAEQNLINGGSQCTSPFIRNIGEYINELGIIGDISSSLDNMAFPIALCDYIDQGKNPDLQMRQNYNVTQNRNNLQRSRIVNTHTMEQYLKNGQNYFHQWSAQKHLKQAIPSKNHKHDKNVKNKKEIDQTDNDDNDIDIDMN